MSPEKKTALSNLSAFAMAEHLRNEEDIAKYQTTEAPHPGTDLQAFTADGTR